MNVTPPTSANPRVLLVGWDAADWQMISPLVDAGLMPHLRRLIEQGVMGDLASMTPMLSPMLWTSIATGKRAYAHGVKGFVEPTADGRGVVPVGTLTRTCKALWNILSQSGRSSIVCAWQASHPAEPVRGAMVSGRFAIATEGSTPAAWPVAPGSVRPEALAASLAGLRTHPSEIDAAILQPFLKNASNLDQSDPLVQRRLTTLADRIAEVAGVHAVATELLETRPWDFTAVYYECIDQVGHDFMPFHPPKMDGVTPADFETYSGVMNGIYQFHDMMLGRLIELAGPDVHVMVVSDHGFESGVGRPRGIVEPARWHRSHGVFVLKGPGIRADQRVEGASLLDIAPTILTLYGLPVGDDMEGKVLASAFDVVPSIARTASWDDLPGEDGQLKRHEADDSASQSPEEAAALRQLADLGYIDAPEADAQRAIEIARAEADFNVGLAYCEGHRAADARRVLAGLVERHPDSARYWRAFAHACLLENVADDASRALTALERLEPDLPTTLVLRGQVAWMQNDLDACLAAFSSAERVVPNDTLTLTYLGRVYLRQRRWADAERVFQHVVLLDPDSAEAHYGLSVALPRQGVVDKGLDHALRAVGLRHDFPEAHFQLGAVLSRLAIYDRAIQAFEMTLRLRPGFLLAHRYLAGIHARAGRSELALKHRMWVDRLTTLRAAQPAVD